MVERKVSAVSDVIDGMFTKHERVALRELEKGIECASVQDDLRMLFPESSLKCFLMNSTGYHLEGEQVRRESRNALKNIDSVLSRMETNREPLFVLAKAKRLVLRLPIQERKVETAGSYIPTDVLQDLKEIFNTNNIPETLHSLFETLSKESQIIKTEKV
eukprot:TRINITY_DN312_c0_g1_i2.p1 TRINITY_DN312_c0_g1~~TRINITY_DN312_c0_g1_i2.p1  ORF type:complete len:160 (+),score=43.59 TRINITY_DN312_c0_g1_i2:644-1123(+)